MSQFAQFIPPLVGGALIGLAAGGFRLATGRIAGISGVFRGALTGPDRAWRVAFIAGLLLAGALAALVAGGQAAAGLEKPALAILVAAGLLVGFGADLSNGCTSGHGVCGLARLSPRSLAAVLTFMATGFITASLASRVFGL